jgi:hypothetical protein
MSDCPSVELSRFDPLTRILCHDDFDNGINGWCELIGNHDGNLDNIREVMADLRPPQLSNCTFFDIGTHGSMSGTYALKLATRARAKHMSQAIKRLTFRSPGLVRVEAYFTFKAEQCFQQDGAHWDGNADPSELNFGDFTFSNDVCEGDDGIRHHCALRYENTDDEGRLKQRWLYKTSVQPSTKMVRSGMVKPNVDYHVIDPSDWREVPGGKQPLCYNELPTKINWHYLRWDFDTKNRCNVELEVNGHVMDLRELPVPCYDHRYKALNRLLNLCIDVRTHRPVRNFLYLDSFVLSVDW